MLTSSKKGLWSTMLSVLGVILFIASYYISETPRSGEKVVIGIVFFTGIALMLASIVFGILGVKSKEKGFLKYVGLMIVLLFIIVLGVMPLLMGIFGFREP